MKIIIKLTTNTTQVLEMEFNIIGIPFEKPHNIYIADCINTTTGKSKYIGSLENETIDDLAIEIRNYLYKFNPISIEVSFADADNFDDGLLQFISTLLSLKR